MFRFSLKAAFAILLLVSVVCALVFAVPEYVRNMVLFLGVLAMPGPLFILARRGDRYWQAFGLGSLTAYGAWFVLVGIPGGFFAINHFGSYFQMPLSTFTSVVPATAPKGLLSGGIIPSYFALAWLGAPWFLAPAAGLGAVLCQMACGEKPSAPDTASLPAGVGAEEFRQPG